MSNAKEVTDLVAVKAQLRDFNVKERSDTAVRDLAACIIALKFLGVGDQLLASTVERTSDHDTDTDSYTILSAASIKDLRVLVGAVRYRVGPLNKTSKPAKKSQPRRKLGKASRSASSTSSEHSTAHQSPKAVAA